MVIRIVHALSEASIQVSHHDSSQIIFFSLITLDDHIEHVNQATDQAARIVQQAIHGQVIPM